eukprot:scaffold422979_cov25-Prasinocladus_malaysianus.AAC.1
MAGLVRASIDGAGWARASRWYAGAQDAPTLAATTESVGERQTDEAFTSSSCAKPTTPASGSRLQSARWS